MTLKLIIAATSIIALILIPRFLIASPMGKENQASGLIAGLLPDCPDKPNCINTEYPNNSNHYLPPLDFTDPIKDQIMPLAKKIIQEMGGVIVKEVVKEDVKESVINGHPYLAATFTSSLFRFVDDFELRQDNISYKLHIRSASRTGYSDFGVNKRRIEQFSQQFNKQIKLLSNER